MKIMTCIFTLLVAAGLGINAAQAQTQSPGTIVFNGGNSSGIFALKLSDGSVRQLTPTGEAVSNPKISPDGCRVVFMVSLGGKAGGGIGIDIMNLDPKNPHRRRLISSGGGVASWSPDKKTIAFGGNDAIWLLDTTETTPAPLPQLLINNGGWPVFSPPSSDRPTRIAFSRQGKRDWDLWIINDINRPNETASLLLPFSGADIDVGGWSSNGLVFAHGPGYDIYTYNPDALNPGPFRLTDSRDNDYEPGWSPDGSMIVFASFRTPGGLYIMKANGDDEKWISSGRQPSWGPDCPPPPTS